VENLNLKPLPPFLKDRVLSECDFILEQIRQEALIKKKLYFFSGLYTAIERVMRLSPDPQLVLLHMALSTCYHSLLALVGNRERGDIAVEIPDNLSATLEAYLKELRDKIEKNDNLYVTIEKFADLAYLSTGAGYYSSLYTQHLAHKTKN
jgi:hypothetical protein